MRHRLLESSEMVEYCDKHSGTVAMPPGGFNPYAVGLAIFRDIEDRWNRGAHGRAWRETADPAARRAVDDGSKDGWRKCLEVRRMCDDAMLIDAYLTPDVMDDLKLYVWGRDPRTGERVILDRDPAVVKKRLLGELVNSGQPVIDLVDANHGNRGELRLVHRYEGQPLREDFAKETLRALHRIWTRPVHIETVIEDKMVQWSFDGAAHATKDLGRVPKSAA
jgi:stage V sporulation protein R